MQDLSKSPTQEESAVLYARLADPPPTIVNSEGCFLTTSDGREILDSTAGAAVVSVGHNNPRVKEAIVRQLDKISYCWAPFFTTESAENLAKILVDSTGGKMSKVFITSSGTEATEAALKMARQYFLELEQPQRCHFIGRLQSYHGNTLGSLAMGGHVPRKKPYLPILAQNISHVSPCYPFRGQKPQESEESYVARLAQELEEEFQRVGPDKVCAFVAETMSGSTLASVPPAPGYLKAIKEVCDRHGALLILDEVMSGIGRTGTLHAWEQEGIVPDLQTIAKGLGAGYMPIGALLVNDRVVGAFRTGSGSFQHSQTYQGHPVACAAAVEVQQIIKDENLMQNVTEMGRYLGMLLEERLGSHKSVGQIRGRGLFWGVEFVQDKETKQPFPAENNLAETISKSALRDHCMTLIPVRGVVDGTRGDAIQVAPPYTVTPPEIELLVERLEATITQVLG
ncbi:Aminotransferase [Exophiala dermatitidis]